MYTMRNNNHFLNIINPGSAVITGASSGMGLAFARKLAQMGFNLILIARRRDRLSRIAAELESEYPIHCDILSADLSLNEDIQKAVNKIKQTDDLDILINNAGFATLGYFHRVPAEKSMAMMQVHTAAPVQLTYAALRIMTGRKQGAIINVSSLGAFTLTPGNVIYDATKSFLVTFSENLSLEVNDKNIRVQALCPGFTRTEFHEVGDFTNFDKTTIPDSLWMSSDEVVSLSLHALEKNKNVIFIPGLKNRLTKWLVQHSSSVRKTIANKVKERDLDNP